MGECICSSCRHLKSTIDAEGSADEYDCKFGVPSDRCETCEEEECDLTCSHYESDDTEERLVTVKCGRCGKELQKACRDDNEEEGYILCIDCFLKG